jgi:putative transposase
VGADGGADTAEGKPASIWRRQAEEGGPERRGRDFFRAAHGSQWEALDETEICRHATAHDRFQEWVEAGVWRKLRAVLLKKYDELKGLDWSWLSVDGSMTKAPLAALGGEKAAPIQPTGASAG